MKRPASLAGLLLPLAACASAAITDPEGGKIVDEKEAGITIYKELVNESVTELIGEIQDKVGGRDRLVAFVGVKNEGNEALKEFRGAIDQEIPFQLDRAELFSTMDNLAIVAAMNAASIDDVGELTLDAPRKRFMAQFGEGGRAPEYLVYAVATTMGSKSGRKKDVEYRLYVRMLHAATGTTAATGRAEQSKQYTKGLFD